MSVGKRYEVSLCTGQGARLWGELDALNTCEAQAAADAAEDAALFAWDRTWGGRYPVRPKPQPVVPRGAKLTIAANERDTEVEKPLERQHHEAPSVRRMPRPDLPTRLGSRPAALGKRPFTWAPVEGEGYSAPPLRLPRRVGWRTESHGLARLPSLTTDGAQQRERQWLASMPDDRRAELVAKIPPGSTPSNALPAPPLEVEIGSLVVVKNSAGPSYQRAPAHARWNEELTESFEGWPLIRNRSKGSKPPNQPVRSGIRVGADSRFWKGASPLTLQVFFPKFEESALGVAVYCIAAAKTRILEWQQRHHTMPELKFPDPRLPYAARERAAAKLPEYARGIAASACANPEELCAQIVSRCRGIGQPPPVWLVRPELIGFLINVISFDKGGGSDAQVAYRTLRAWLSDRATLANEIRTRGEALAKRLEQSLHGNEGIAEAEKARKYFGALARFASGKNLELRLVRPPSDTLTFSPFADAALRHTGSTGALGQLMRSRAARGIDDLNDIEARQTGPRKKFSNS